MTRKPEIALLLECTTVPIDKQAESRIRRLIEQGVDWSVLLQIAIPHGVLPLFSRNLFLHAADLVSPSTLAQLNSYRKKVALRNQRQSEELIRLMAAFSRENISMLPFKGPSLAALCYGDVGLRESHDLDFWVDPAQFARASEWFLDAGYRPIKHVLGVPQEVPQVRSGADSFSSFDGFATPDGRVLIELKDHLEPLKGSVDYDPQFGPVWERRRFITLDGSSIPVFAVEDLLPALAVHGSKHRWRRLNWIVDVAAVISTSPGIDWEAMQLRAKELRCWHRLVVAVTLTRRLYPVQVPDSYQAAARKAGIEAAVRHIQTALFSEQARSIRSFISENLYNLQVCDTGSGRLRSARHSLARIVRADQAQMFSPMSENLHTLYRAIAASRSWFGRSNLFV